MPKTGGLPRAIIKKYGISKKAWQVYRGKSKKRKTYKSNTTKKSRTKMAKRRYYKKRHRRRPKKFSILPMIGAGASLMTNADGHTSPWQGIMNVAQGDMGWIPHLMNDILANYAGIDTREAFRGRFYIPWGTVTIMTSVIMSKVLSWFGANKVFTNAPGPLKRLKW